MAGLEDFYSRRSDQDESTWRSQRRPVTVPQFEPESGRSFFGPGIKNSSPKLLNLDPKRPDATDSSASADHYAGLGIGVAGLVAESLIAHPFIVLRRSCQVSSTTVRHHRTPLTLVPAIIRLYRAQGIPCLWKGFGSSLIVRGLHLTAEDCLGKLTPLPKEIDGPTSPKMVGQHLLLKVASLAIVTPFFSVSLIESVQSDIASESPGILDIFREGITRIFQGGGPRAFPMWYLIPVTVSYGLLHYVIATSVKFVTCKLMKCSFRLKQESCGAVSKREEDIPGLNQYRERVSSIAGSLVGDVLLFPFETILHRLHLQGSRTIIDNLDTGREVLPVTTGYLGVTDCANEIIASEGVAGFFRGFGALMLQYALQFAIVRLSTLSIREIMKLLKDDSLESVRPSALSLDASPRDSSVAKASERSTPTRPVESFPSRPATSTPRPYDPYSRQELRLTDPLSSPRSTNGFSNQQTSRPADPFAPSNLSSSMFSRQDSRPVDPFLADQEKFYQDMTGGTQPSRRKLLPDF